MSRRRPEHPSGAHGPPPSMAVGARVGRAVVWVGGALLAALAVISGLVTVIDIAGDAGVWSACWRYWGHGWTVVLLLVVWFLAAISVVTCAAEAPEDRDWQGIQWALGAAALVAALVDGLAFARPLASFLVGTTIAGVGTCFWTVGWVRSRRLHDGVTARRAVIDGLAELGGHMSWVRDLVAGALRGPRGRAHLDDGRPAPGRLSGVAAVAAGLVVMAIGVATVLGVGTAAAYTIGAVVAELRDDERGAESDGLEQRGLAGAAAASTTSSTSVPSTSAPASGGAPDDAPSDRPGPDCDRYEIGTGPDVDDSVRIAAAETISVIDATFTVCPLGWLELDAVHGVHRQPVATLDGDGGLLVVAVLDGGYSVTFVSADEGAAYSEIEPDLLDIGIPLPFRRCGELYVQPFVTPDGLIAGVGLRNRADEEGEPDRPIFAWGATVESLLEQRGHLVMPVGSPVDDDDLQYQGFEGGTRIDDALRPAGDLRPEDLAATCPG